MNNLENKNIKSLIKKDFILLKTYKKAMLIMLFFFIVTIILNYKNDFKNSLNLYIVLISLFYFLFSLSYASLYVDESSKFYEYIKILPLSKRDYIKAKYYFAAMIYFIEFIIFILGTKEINFSIILISFQILMGAIIINVFFKYGQAKMRLVLTSLFVISFLLLGIFTKLGFNLLRESINGLSYMKLIPYIVFLFSIIIFLLFMNKTIKEVEKKC